MSYTIYTAISTSNHPDARACVDAINRKLADSGDSINQAAAQAELDSYPAESISVYGLKIEAEVVTQIADKYAGGRVTSTPEDQFYADGVKVEMVGDDGEYTIFEFEDDSRVKINADGEIFAV